MAIRYLDKETPKKIRYFDEEQDILQKPILDQKPGILSGVTALSKVPLEFSPGEKIQEYAEDPTGTKIKLLRAAELGGQAASVALPGAGQFISAPITAGAEFAIKKLQDKPTKEAAIEALTLGGADALMTGLSPLLTKAGTAAIKGSKGFLKKIIPLATGIPEETTEIVLKKPQILKGKINLVEKFDKLGEKAQKAINYIEKEAGKAVGKETRAIRRLKDHVDFSSVPKRLDRNLKVAAGGQYIPDEDIAKINYFKDKLTASNNASAKPIELYKIRQEIDDTLSWAQNKVAPLSSRGDAILKNARDQINKKLSKISPEFSEVSKNFSEIKKLKKDVTPRLKDVNAGVNVQNIFAKDIATDKKVAFLKEFEQIDKLAPDNLKFVQEAKEALARDQFEKWIPRKQLLGATRLVGAAGVGLGAQYNNPGLMAAGAVLAAGTSPKAYKSLIKSGAGVTKLGRALSTSPTAQVAKKQAVTRLTDLLQNRR